MSLHTCFDTAHQREETSLSAGSGVNCFRGTQPEPNWMEKFSKRILPLNADVRTGLGDGPWAALLRGWSKLVG